MGAPLSPPPPKASSGARTHSFSFFYSGQRLPSRFFVYADSSSMHFQKIAPLRPPAAFSGRNRFSYCRQAVAALNTFVGGPHGYSRLSSQFYSQQRGRAQLARTDLSSYIFLRRVLFL